MERNYQLPSHKGESETKKNYSRRPLSYLLHGRRICYPLIVELSNIIEYLGTSFCHKLPCQMDDLVQLLTKMHSTPDKDTLALYRVVMRNLWLRRNNLHVNQVFLSPN